MLPTALTFQNYRSFVGPQRLELRPLTLLFGVNNAGKSSLLRALPLIGASLRADVEGPLDLECPAMYGASFEDICWRGKSAEFDEDMDDRDDAHQGLRVTLHWDTGSPRAIDYVFDRVESQHNPLLRRLRVRYFATQGEDGWTHARQELLRSEENAAALTYEVRHDRESTSTPFPVEFEGLCPRVPIGTAEPPWFSAAQARLLALRGQIQWLRAKRQPPQRYSTRPSTPRSHLHEDGSDTALLLAARPELRSAVSSWYEQMVGRRLVLEESPPAAFRTQLQLLSTGNAIDLLDSGEGMNQVLSVLSALELVRLGGRAPRLLALEEPESHLHPQLQRGLVERLVEVVSQEDPPRIVLETHSEYLLLGIQLAIAQERLRPRDVAVYWIRQYDDGHSVAELSTFDALAFPQGAWPAGVFSEDTQLAREIIRERKRRSA